MKFNSLEFIFIFLPLIIIIFYQFKSNLLSKIFLIFASLFFYAYWDYQYLTLLIFSVLFNFYIGTSLKHNPKKFVLSIGICINLCLLGYFKYFNFFIDNSNYWFDLSLSNTAIILPLAISFFTFQQIAFLVDSYTRKINELRFIDYSLFVCFFPQLIAGPIVHHATVIPQFKNKTIFNFSIENFNIGLTIFSFGLFKKLILADNIGEYSDAVFLASSDGIQITLFEAWAAGISYTFQLYFDFSGYSDMAIGLGLFFNIKLPENFKSPLKARSIIEFWKRWHITLSAFLKNYLYIPLGGNRNGQFRRFINLMITMLLGGIWHGAGWTFFIWGGLHGFYLMLNHIFRNLMKSGDKSISFYQKFFFQLVTFIAVVFAFVIFRSDNLNSAWIMVKAMAGFNATIPAMPQLIDLFPQGTEIGPDKGPIKCLIVWLPICAVVAFFLPNTMEWINKERKIKWQPDLKCALITGLILIFALLGLYRNNTFLYFQF